MGGGRSDRMLEEMKKERGYVLRVIGLEMEKGRDKTKKGRRKGSRKQEENEKETRRKLCRRRDKQKPKQKERHAELQAGSSMQWLGGGMSRGQYKP